MTNSPRNRVCFFHYLAGIFVFLWLSTALLHPLSAVENHMSAKLDPTLVGLALFGTDSRPFTLSKSIARNDSITVFIRSGKMDALRQAGYAIHPLSETVATAFLPFRQILDLSYREDVEGIETASLCRPALDVSTVDIRAKEVWTGFGGGYTGKGVIVGIIDSGIDWQHEDFIRADGTSRLLYIWDQTDDAGSGPAGYTIKGSLYSRAQINDELDGTPKGLVRQKDTHGHGTHVAGIAAGNGRGTGEGKDPGTYVGVAPEAEIIVVKAGDGSYGTVNISEGIRFVFDKAHELNMPAVVNVSLGTLFGSHDGTSDFERGLNELLVDPGRAVVVAAGNEGNKPVHFKKVFSSLFQNVTSIPFQINDNRNGLIDQFSFNVWYTNSSLSVSVITPSGRTFGPVASGSLPQQHNTGEGQLYIYNALTGKDLDNGDRQIRIDFSDSGNDHSSMDNLAVGTWNLVFNGKAGRIDGWLYDPNDLDIAELTGEIDYGTLVNEPGNARLAITAGAYVSRNTWMSLNFNYPIQVASEVGSLCGFSSPGPTRPTSLDTVSGRKPDVVAPGEFVLSTLSGQMESTPEKGTVATDSRHWAMRGTSMAAPHVAGVVALMFQARPSLTASQIRDKLFKSVRNDAATGTGWNRFSGYGKIDAYEAMKQLTSVHADEGISPNGFRLESNYPNPFNASTTIVFSVPKPFNRDGSVRIDIFDLNGRTVLSMKLNGLEAERGRWVWDARDWRGDPVPSGVYCCRARFGPEVLSRKMVLIR